jgi:serine acetyltransferase
MNSYQTQKLGFNNIFILRIVNTPFNFFLRFILHLELPKNSFDRKIRLPHPYNIIVNGDSQIGSNCTIFHQVTIGSQREFGTNPGSPIIGNNVIIFPNTVIIGNVSVGDNVIIGAGSIVTRDIPENSIVAGNPARLIKNIK